MSNPYLLKKNTGNSHSIMLTAPSHAQQYSQGVWTLPNTSSSHQLFHPSLYGTTPSLASSAVPTTGPSRLAPQMLTYQQAPAMGQFFPSTWFSPVLVRESQSLPTETPVKKLKLSTLEGNMYSRQPQMNDSTINPSRNNSYFIPTCSIPGPEFFRSQIMPVSNVQLKEEFKDVENEEQIHLDPNNRNNILSKLKGEEKLVIQFESYGDLGDSIQTLGKTGIIIPDGLCGMHTSYNQSWKFEIHHVRNEENAPCLRFRITHLNSNQVCEVTESLSETEKRNNLGWTICNKIFRIALKNLTKHLEEELSREKDPGQIEVIRSAVKVLKPKRFAGGLLLFGLQHRIVQKKMSRLLEERERDSFAVTPSIQ